MITITINFSSSKTLCGLSMMYWVETVTDFQYRDQIRGISSPSYVQVRSKKPMICSFLPENCSKYALVGSWWVSGADQQYTDHIFLKFEIWDGVHLLLINSTILSVNFFLFTIILLFFHKRIYKLCIP